MSDVFPAHGMTRARYEEAEEKGELTHEEQLAGWHFCDDWDQLLINVLDEEAEYCGCGFKERRLKLLGGKHAPHTST